MPRFQISLLIVMNNIKDYKIQSMIADTNTIFPSNKLVGFKFKDIKQVRDVLKCQAIERHLTGVDSWFYLASQDQKFTLMKCKVVGSCRAQIKLLFLGSEGFLIDSLFSLHDHSKNQLFNQLKSHHILSPFIGSLLCSKPLKQVRDELHIVKTNCCCKNNPGETAIAYSVTNLQGQLIIQRSQVFSDFTINKGQFIVIMHAILDCHQNGIMKLQIRSRSKLIIDFMNGISNISAPGLRDIAEASKLLTSRLSGSVVYKIMAKNESSPKLQNMCRKLLNLQAIQEKKK